MRLRKVTGLLLTAVCAASFLCPAAWAAGMQTIEVRTEAYPNKTSIFKDGELSIFYTIQESDITDRAAFSDEFRKWAKETVAQTGNSLVVLDAPDRAEVETMLGTKVAFSTAIDALPKQEGYDAIITGSDMLDLDYLQRRKDGDTLIMLQSTIRSDKKFVGRSEEISFGGASLEKADYTTPGGEHYQIWSTKDKTGKIISQYVLFRHGKVCYELLASNSRDGLAQEYLYPYLDGMVFPELPEEK